MSHFLFHNGKFVKEDTPLLTASNRGIRYGDGLFETMKLVNGEINFAGYHFERLFNGMKMLGFEIPAYFTPSWLSEKTVLLCAKNKHQIARIRLMVYRGEGGVYDPQNHLPNYVIQSWVLEESKFRLNENGLVTGVFSDARKSTDRFSNLKSNNYLTYLMAAREAKKQQWNDALVMNTFDRVCDASIANVFIVKNKIILTPSLKEGCIAGVVRRFLLERMPAAGFDIKEAELSISNIKDADELFLTNAIRGFRWVQHCDNVEYKSRFTNDFFNAFMEMIG